jgi:hypothetical protein
MFMKARWGRYFAAAALLAASLLSSCGGGDLVEPFSPTRQLTFGDESSVLTADGKNYSINGLDATGAIDCALHPNWAHFLATDFGFVFPPCNPTGVAATEVTLYAQPGAKVADLVAQIDAHLATSGFGRHDLVTVLVGTHDVLEQYALYPGVDEGTLTAELRRRGSLLAEQVNRIANMDGRIIVSTIPDLGLTPFAGAEEAANPGRAALLGRLSATFNARMRATLINDGRLIGIVLADDLTQVATRNPEVYSMVNVTQAACAVAPPDCTTATLVPGGHPTAWLWAASTQFSPGGHIQLGSAAITRARNNPF